MIEKDKSDTHNPYLSLVSKNSTVSDWKIIMNK